MVLQWAPTERYVEVCKDLICNVEKLGEEVKILNELVAKVGARSEAITHCKFLCAVPNVTFISEMFDTLFYQL